MTEIFTSGDRANDLIEWAGKLDCLGGVLQSLADSNDTEPLSWYGGGIGSIIRDYAQAMEALLTAVDYRELLDVLGEHDSPEFIKIDTDFRALKGMPVNAPTRSERIEESLKDIEKVKKTVSFIFDMEKELEGMKKQSAPVKNSAKTVA
jgi:hypothetical protein